MKECFLYQIRLELEEKAAKDFILNNIQKHCTGLRTILTREKAILISQFEAFTLFVKECEENNQVNMPLYKWTKDTVENQSKKKKYLKSFTIYVDKQQLYKKNIADRLEKNISSLNCKCILKINKYDSNPRNNPQPPKKYF
tara:strand:- start:201 stop:623 length:423 start_codon:yes stop_codon:yes gene_type:complete